MLYFGYNKQQKCVCARVSMKIYNVIGISAGILRASLSALGVRALNRLHQERVCETAQYCLVSEGLRHLHQARHQRGPVLLYVRYSDTQRVLYLLCVRLHGT